MKKLLPLLVFCISFFAVAQNIERVNVDGKIIVEGNDIEGISIYNSSSEVGTVTNEKGEFTIAVASQDLLKIRALEYQNFDVRINDAILESKKLSIFLIEEINKLDEVIITTRGLSGILEADINSIKTFNPKLNALYFGMKDNDGAGIGDFAGQIENTGMISQGQSLVNGLNVVNIVDQLLIPLFRSKVKDKEAAGVPEVPSTSVKHYLGSTFLVENFEIPEHRVEEFIRYVEDETFNLDYLNYGNEIEFLELLNKKSEVFLNPKSDKD